jgi:hypothetical protein
VQLFLDLQLPLQLQLEPLETRDHGSEMVVPDQFTELFSKLIYQQSLLLLLLILLMPPPIKLLMNSVASSASRVRSVPREPSGALPDGTTSTPNWLWPRTIQNKRQDQPQIKSLPGLSLVPELVLQHCLVEIKVPAATPSIKLSHSLV